MHFLARLIHGNVAVMEELAKDEQALHQELAQFFQSYAIKDEVLEHLMRNEPIHLHLNKLNFALEKEINIVEQTEHTEQEIITDLKYISKEHYLKRFNEICVELEHAKTRDEFIKHILSEIHYTILAEARKVRRLLNGDTDFELRDALIDLLTIEHHLVEKLTTIEDFQKLFGDIFVGTKKKNAISASKKRLQSRMKNLMRQVEVNQNGVVTPTEDHYISSLTARVCNKLEDATMDAVKGGYIRQHPHVDQEFVNSKLFEEFLQRELLLDKRLGKFIPSQNTIQTFVYVFREMYTPMVTV